MSINKLKDEILKGYKITKKEAFLLVDEDLDILNKHANEIREKMCGNNFEFCTIINAKSGKCFEDCRYCSQSKFYHTNVEEYDLLSRDEILKSAKSNENAGVDRFSIVTSGKKLNKKELSKVIGTYMKLSEKCGIKLCGSLGLLDYEDFIKLKKAGMTRYHNNIETSRGYFPKICTTHTFEEKINTINKAKRAGLEICSGGIFGLGESMMDRIDMAFTLRDLDVVSVPINILNPIKGTPLENNTPLSHKEILRSISIYRFILPSKNIRLAGGRTMMSDKGRSAIKSGINSAISGDMLTTSGIKTNEDIIMVKELGFEV